MANNKRVINFLIVGAGAIGKLFAAFLCLIARLFSGKCQISVYLLARNEKYDAIREYGVELKIGPVLLEAKGLIVINDLSQMKTSTNTIVIIATKAYQLEEAIKSLKNFFGFNELLGIILPINGIGIEEIIRPPKSAKPYFNCPLITCAITLPVNVFSGESQFAEITKYNGGFAFAPFDGFMDDPIYKMIVEMFESACQEINNMLKQSGVKFNPKKAKKRGLETFSYQSTQNVRWTKLILNIIANILAAILRMTPKEIYDNRTALEIEWGMLNETFQVIDVYGYELIPLPGYPVNDLKWLRFLVTNDEMPCKPLHFIKLLYFVRFLVFRYIFGAKIIQARGDRKPSMDQDAEKGKKTEAPWYNGAIADAGEAINLDVHFNRALTTIMGKITKKEYGPDTYKKSPSKLMMSIIKYKRA